MAVFAMHVAIAPLLFLAATTVVANPVSRAATLSVSVVQANSSTRWFEDSSEVQIFDVVVKNTGNTWLTTKDNLTVYVDSPSLITTRPASVKRLRPNDSAVVEVGVVNKPGVADGSSGPATAVAEWDSQGKSSLDITATYGIPTYDPTKSSVDQHEAPDWWRKGKFGIFIHWGLYSVPAWGNVGANESYAEWYWSHQMNPNDKTQTYEWGLEHYGPLFIYDDFIANFTADNFNPKDWVDLFADAGARYFVQVTKHHDGFALFNMSDSISERNSVAQNPHRDFLKEVFGAAKQYQPQLHRGTYYSLPEWFNPLYTPYTLKGEFGVGPPKNPYTNESVPYTGLVEVGDYLADFQLPSMNILANDYDTDIMWCDIGGANMAPQFAAPWINAAREQNRQVTINNRCGGIDGDFQTPEYASSTTLTTTPWEATRGMDPDSFGFNAATPDSAYMTASDVVTSLVDVVAKNGNLLLDVGPRGDGTIPGVMSTHLREAGKWFKAHSESIFDTKYWPSGPGMGVFRYTTTEDAFYIHVMNQPEGSLVVPDLVPYLAGDRVTVVGGSKSGAVVPSRQLANGSLVLDVSADIGNADQYTWTFKITY